MYSENSEWNRSQLQSYEEQGVKGLQIGKSPYYMNVTYSNYEAEGASLDFVHIDDSHRSMYTQGIYLRDLIKFLGIPKEDVLKAYDEVEGNE